MVARRRQQRPFAAVLTLAALLVCGPRVGFLAPTLGHRGWQAAPRARVVAVARAQESPAAVTFEAGDVVSAVYPDDGEWYPGKVEKTNDDGTIEVRWEDPDGGPETSPVKLEDIQKEVPLIPLEELPRGEKIKGRVTGSRDFGAFINVGAEREGLLHVSQFPQPKTGKFEEGDAVEAAYPDDGEIYPGVIGKDNGDGTFEVKWDDPDGGPESHPVQESDIKHGPVQYNVDDEVEVYVARVTDDGKLSFSLTPPPPPPNLALMEGVHPDEVLDGVVAKVAPFGAFVMVTPPGGGDAQRGLVHISQISDEFVSDINEVVQEGQEVKVRVMNVDAANNKMSLTMKGN